MENKNKQSLVFYGSNFLGGFAPNLGNYFNKGFFNPAGAVIFGGLNIAKKIHSSVDNPYVRLLELGGAAYYSVSAFANFVSMFDGRTDGLGKGFMDSLMAYQLLKNEGVLDNIRTDKTKADIKKVKVDLENLLGAKTTPESKDDDWYRK